MNTGTLGRDLRNIGPKIGTIIYLRNNSYNNYTYLYLHPANVGT